MATSGVVDGSFTVADLVRDALSLIQIGIGSETVKAQYQATCITTFKLMARAWQVDGVRLWLNQTLSVTLIDGQADYTLSVRALELYEAYRRSGSGSTINDVPIRIFTREEYERLPNKTTTGSPYAAYMDRERTSSIVSLYPVPGAAEVAQTMSARLIIKRPIQDVTDGSEDWEMPPEWAAALTYNLAVWAAPKFNKEASPTVKVIAENAYGVLSGQDREGSIYMRPRRIR